LNLRNLIVAPLGVKTSGDGEPASGGVIGLFPVLSETPERLVAGFNDSHLDFRVVVDVASAGSSQQVTTTTLVLTHNWLGRTYLAVIMPFHRLVTRSMLRQVAGSTHDLSVDLFFSFRSPYSYLALPKTLKLVAECDATVNLRPVYPLAVRGPGFSRRPIRNSRATWCSTVAVSRSTRTSRSAFLAPIRLCRT
jgi:hypothetical protein